MASILTKQQFVEILQDKDVTKTEDIAVFQTIFSFEEHKAYASQVGRILGSKSKTPGSSINLQIGRLGKRLAKKNEVNFTIRENQKFKFWDIIYDGWEKGRLFVWQLKPNLIKALIEAELTGEVQYSEEIPIEYLEKLFEGAKRTVIVNAYERNAKARQLCISHWGIKCIVCEFDFEKEYGETGKNFIHVHHIIPIAEIGKIYEIDPIRDLRPVCPNCHSMIHKEKDTLTIDELKKYYKNAQEKINTNA